MDRHKHSGFTIIEVVLFLAISGVLGVGILTAASAGINQQRYKDSVRSLYSQLQSEYSRVINVENGRVGQYRCDSAGVVDASEGGATGAAEPRGTSDCMVVGRLVDVSGSSDVLRSEPVYATLNAASSSTITNDKLALEASGLRVANADLNGPELNRTDYTLEWGTRIVDKSGSPLQFRLLIVRSPHSGMIRTYAISGSSLPSINSGSIRSMIGEEKPVTACVDSTGLFSGPRMGVNIASLASSTSGLSMTTATEGESLC